MKSQIEVMETRPTMKANHERSNFKPSILVEFCGGKDKKTAGRRPALVRGPAVARWPRVDAWTCRAVSIFVEIFFLPALHFLLKWSTLSHWLQHMPALPRLLLETSNIHNF
jgi:hypothetical protein